MRLTGWIGLMLATAACSTSESRETPSTASATRPAAPTAAQLIAARQAGMHMAATLLYTGIKQAVETEADVTKVAHEPEGIALWAAAIPGLFPAGSGGVDSRAKPEIWANKADFDGKAAELLSAAERLATLAHAGDKAGFAAQVPAVHAACAACHSVYRAD